MKWKTYSQKHRLYGPSSSLVLYEKVTTISLGKTSFSTPLTEAKLLSVGSTIHRAFPKYLAWFTDALDVVKPDSTHWTMAAVVSHHQLSRTANGMLSLFIGLNTKLWACLWPILPLFKFVIVSLALELRLKRLSSYFVSWLQNYKIKDTSLGKCTWFVSTWLLIMATNQTLDYSHKMHTVRVF